MSKMINRISILYNKEDRERVVYLANFLKWMGIMVNTRSYSMIEKITNSKLDESGYYDYIIVDSDIPNNINIEFSNDKIIYNDNNNLESLLNKLFDSNIIKDLLDLYNRNNIFINDLILEGNLFHTKEEKLEILHNYKKAVDDIYLISSIHKESVYLKYILYSTMLKVNYINKILGFFLVYEPNLSHELNKLVNNDNELKSFYLLMGKYNKLTNCKGNIIPYYEKALDSWNPINSQIYYKIANDISYFDDEYFLVKYDLKKLFYKIRHLDPFSKLPEFCENIFYYNEESIKEEYEKYLLIEELKSDLENMTPKEFNKYIYFIYQYNRFLREKQDNFSNLINTFLESNKFIKKLPSNIYDSYVNDILTKKNKIIKKLEKNKNITV